MSKTIKTEKWNPFKTENSNTQHEVAETTNTENQKLETTK